jgi:LysM repeat protein
VHAGPVAALLREYDLDAEARYGMSWDELRSEIVAGRPVIVWIIGRVQRGKPVRYKSSDDHKTIVARYEHTVIVIGYGASSVYMIDAATGKSSKHSRRAFLASWRVLGNMAVTGQAQKPETPPLPEGSSFYLPAILLGGSPSGVTSASIPIPPGNTYIVPSDESLAEIAQRYNVSWSSLVEANHLRPPYIILPGQKLKIPLNE